MAAAVYAAGLFQPRSGKHPGLFYDHLGVNIVTAGQCERLLGAKYRLDPRSLLRAGEDIARERSSRGGPRRRTGNANRSRDCAGAPAGVSTPLAGVLHGATLAGSSASRAPKPTFSGIKSHANLAGDRVPSERSPPRQSPLSSRSSRSGMSLDVGRSGRARSCS